MLKNQIKEFYGRVLNDSDFKNAIAAFLQEIGTTKATPEVTALVIKEVILPYARSLGYNFTLKDLLEFETTEKVMVKVQDEEQVAISGGNAWSNLRRVGNNIYNRLPRKATVFKAMGVAGALIGAAAGAYGLYNMLQDFISEPNGNDNDVCDAYYGPGNDQGKNEYYNYNYGVCGKKSPIDAHEGKHWEYFNYGTTPTYPGWYSNGTNFTTQYYK